MLPNILREDDRFDGPDPVLESERLREARWNEFVAWCKGMTHGDDDKWGVLAWRLADAFSNAAEDHTITAFADEFGWADTWSAFARALREAHTERCELFNRR